MTSLTLWQDPLNVYAIKRYIRKSRASFLFNKHSSIFSTIESEVQEVKKSRMYRKKSIRATQSICEIIDNLKNSEETSQGFHLVISIFYNLIVKTSKKSFQIILINLTPDLNTFALLLHFIFYFASSSYHVSHQRK